MRIQLPRQQFSVAIVISLLTGFAPYARAQQAWSTKPVRKVVAFPAVGGSDFLARQLAPQLGKQPGQPIVIGNRPGAAGMIGTDHAANPHPMATPC